MCGIHAVISSAGETITELDHSLISRLRARGPDHVHTEHAEVNGSVQVQLTSTVLSLRGDHIAEQPLAEDATGSILCWNGEVWRLSGQTLEGNDTEAVFSRLLNASSQRSDADYEGASDPVLQALGAIEGPFAFVYLDKPAKRLYFGRDRLGRRSLLIKHGASSLTLASIAEPPSEDWVEVEADGCYTLQLDSSSLAITRHGWHSDASLISGIGRINSQLTDSPPPLTPASLAVKELHQCLVQSLSPRILNIPVPPKASDADARLAILFSGGLDCTMLARIASDIVPEDQSIDLINVAFENPRIASQNKNLALGQLYEQCPDRRTARQSFSELLKVCPGRTWRLVTVDVPFQDTCEHRSEIIALMHPHDTEMDLSIASALYFAARGQGRAVTGDQMEASSYTTTARVLLSGLGADELFGGYSRHGVAFTRGGYAGLIDELKLDVSRLGQRNLGRDDRVMSHWGKEVRFPFLDERLVKWAIEKPAWEKCDFHSSTSPDDLDAEKRVLRILAGNMGMKLVAREKKRAIQFGARTAKMQSGRVKGTTSISR